MGPAAEEVGRGEFIINQWCLICEWCKFIKSLNTSGNHSLGLLKRLS